VTLLGDVVRHLEANNVSTALIGAAALSVYGIARSTIDSDLLVTERRVLTAAFWSALASSAEIDVRVGDYDDPLAGVVRIRRGSERVIDVVVARERFAAAILGRTFRAEEQGELVPVALLSDLVLLKLFAGGPQDAWDIQQVLLGDRDVVGDVDAHIEELPIAARNLWARLLSSPR
jgi:hypothetical protein